MSTLKSSIKIERNRDFTKEELLSFAQSLSSKEGGIKDKLLHWDFGPLMEMKYSAEAQNYLFSDEVVPLHWDGAFHVEPRILLFYCTDSVGEGGETLFCNTELLWESLTESEKEQCRKVMMVYRTEKKAHYGGEIRIPLVQKHPLTGKTILRFAERVETKLNPVTLTIEGVENASEFYSKMVKKLYHPSFLYMHAWQKGDLVLADNFTYLHGRLPLRENRGRTFYRLQIL